MKKYHGLTWKDLESNSWSELEGKTWAELYDDVLETKSATLFRQHINRIEDNHRYTGSSTYKVISIDVSSGRYDQYMGMLPKYLRGGGYVKGIGRSIDRDIRRTDTEKELCESYLAISTTNFLKLHEKEYGIRTNYKLGTEFRRGRVKVRKQARYRLFSKESVVHYGKLLGQDVLDVSVDKGEQTLSILYRKNENFKIFEEFIEEIMPAHMDVTFSDGGRWMDLEGITWGELESKKWYEIEEGKYGNNG